MTILLEGTRYKLETVGPEDYKLIRFGNDGWQKVSHIGGDATIDFAESLADVEADHPEWSDDETLEYLWINYDFGNWAKFEKVTA